MSQKMDFTSILKYFNDEGKHHRETLQWALQIFNDGINDYYRDRLTDFHALLVSQTQHLTARCTSHCSKSKASLGDWCAVCSTWRTAILSRHKHRSTIAKTFDWKLVDSEKWPCDIEEVMKVFLPTWCKGSEDINDISVRLNIMINCQFFGNYLQLREIRDIRNDIAHSQSITNGRKREMIQKLTEFLDMDKLRNYHSAQKSASAIATLKEWNIKDVIEHELIEEKYRELMEKELYGKRRKKNYLFLFGIKCICIAVIVGFVLYTPLHPDEGGASQEVLKSKKNVCEMINNLDAYFFKEHQDISGRAWLKSQIFKKSKRDQNGLILIAGPGFGKSALVSDIIQKYNETDLPLLGFHICQYDSPISCDSSEFVKRLVTMLKCKINYYKKEWQANKHTMEEMYTRCDRDPMYCFQELIGRHKKSLKLKQRFLMIIDGLDECQSIQWGFKKMSVLDLLAKHSDILQQFTKMLITARNDTSLIARLRFLETFYVLPDNPNNLQDMKAFIQRKRKCGKQRLGKIVEESGYNFLIMKYYDNYLNENCDTNSVNFFPSTISQMYEAEFSRLYGSDFGTEYLYDRSFFEVLISKQMTEPLTITTIREVLRYASPPLLDDFEFNNVLRRIKPHLIRVTDDSKIHLIHTTLRDWLLSRQDLPFYINVDYGHHTWIRYFHATLKPPENIPEVKCFDGAENPSDVLDAITLAIHYSQINNKTFEDVMASGNLKFLNITVSVVCPTQYHEIRQHVSHVGIAAALIDDFRILQILVLLSNLNDLSFEAQIAVMHENIHSLRALVESGLVDLKRKHLVHHRLIDNRIFAPSYSYEKSRDTWNEIQTKTLSPITCNMLAVFYSQRNSSNRIDAYVDHLTLLHSMIDISSLEGLHYLLSKDESLAYDKTTKGLDALDLAIATNNITILKYISKIIPLKAKSWYLLFAAHVGSNDVLILLLLLGIKDMCPKCRNNLIRSSKGEYTILPSNVNVSFSKNSSFSKADSFYLRFELTCSTALMAAARIGNAEAVELFLLFGSSLECKDSIGMTPLAAAMYMRREEVISLLLRYGADLDFTVTPSNYSLRAHLINRHFLLPSENPWMEKSLLVGAKLVHLASLRPTCRSAGIVQRTINALTSEKSKYLDSKDTNGRTPLYYSLCHPEAYNAYNTLENVVMPQSHRMAFFHIEAMSAKVNSFLLNELRLCGSKVRYMSCLFVNCGKKSKNICERRPETFPRLKDIRLITAFPEFKNMYSTRKGTTWKTAVEISATTPDRKLFGLAFMNDTNAAIDDLIKQMYTLYGEENKEIFHMLKFPSMIPTVWIQC